MLLTIDIGNTNITLGLFNGQKLGDRWRLATDHERMADEYGLQISALLQHVNCDRNCIEGVCMASVVPPLTGRIIQACKQYLNHTPVLIDHKANTGLNILYEDPSAVGADRIVDAVAVRELYSLPACVIDFGTGTTFDAINANGDYLGGAIAPGLSIGADALYQRTAKLPRVNLEAPPSVIGRNTVHAIQAGLVYGYVSMVEGMVVRFRHLLGKEMKVIATGGLAEIITHETQVIDYVAPWLTLDGLRILWEMNR
ncbi:MAG: type III pantothenate kinase [Anaerolineae bacterium]|nr:type III pantothenate kinase [Anaerolineae bacterium]